MGYDIKIKSTNDTFYYPSSQAAQCNWELYSTNSGISRLKIFTEEINDILWWFLLSLISRTMKEKRTAFYTGSPLLLNNIPVLPASLSHNIGFRYRSPAPEVTVIYWWKMSSMWKIELGRCHPALFMFESSTFNSIMFSSPNTFFHPMQCYIKWKNHLIS